MRKKSAATAGAGKVAVLGRNRNHRALSQVCEIAHETTSPSDAKAGPEKQAPLTAINTRLKLIGWQGFTVRVPDWELTGFSGDDQNGYLRVDDSEEQGIEIKWGTIAKRVKKEPNISDRLTEYLRSLVKTARKKKIELTIEEGAAPKSVERNDRSGLGFQWTGDRKAYGAIWFCRTCRRVVIAQVLGDVSGRNRLNDVASRVLGSLECHSADPKWRVWSLYDLYTEVPTEYLLVGQQLMNVYLRLSFARQAERLTVEQWAIANVARKDEYLDNWLAINSKGEMNQAHYRAEEGENNGHPALCLSGGWAIGLPMTQPLQHLSRLQKPATRFSAVAWECEASNKVYLVQGFRSRGTDDVVSETARRIVCHGKH